MNLDRQFCEDEAIAEAHHALLHFKQHKSKIRTCWLSAV
jgi:hypothetical protein